MQIQSLGWEDPQEDGWQPTPVFLPEESHGQRSLAGCSPEGCTELDMTEVTEQQWQSMGATGQAQLTPTR